MIVDQKAHSVQDKKPENSVSQTINSVAPSEKSSVTQNTKNKDKKPETLTLENLQAQIAQLEEKCKEFQDKYLLAKADLDNARKRFVKDKEDVRFQTICWICLPIINIFDSFKMGLESAEKHHIADDVLKGFQMIFQLFQSQLKLVGIEEINPQGEAFNPYLHEAVSQAFNTTVPEDHILQVVRVGYKLGDKLLRAASVVVSKGKEPQINEK